MSAHREQLLNELRDEEYREAYGEQHVNSVLAAQISTIREQRGLSQSALATKIGKQQPAISRIENVNYARWNVQTLRQIASALGCWLNIRLESWGRLVDDAESLTNDSLRRPVFEHDPAFYGSEAQHSLPEPVRWMQKDLLPWLNNAGDNSQLVRWLEGSDLPSFGDADPPFLWITRAVKAEPSTSPYASLLSDRTTSLLSEMQKPASTVKATAELYIGVFALLANFPSIEGWNLLQKLNTNPMQAMKSIPKSALPTFLSALINNQIDGSLEDEWIATIENGAHRWLPATEHDGFEGLKWMVPRPRIKAISRGLQKLWMAKRLRPDRNINLTSVMAALKYFFKEDTFLAEMLLREGHQIDWHTSIVDAWAEVFTKDALDREELLKRVPPTERRVINSIIGAHSTARASIQARAVVASTDPGAPRAEQESLVEAG